MPNTGLVANARQDDGQTDPETLLAWLNECHNTVLQLLQRLGSTKLSQLLAAVTIFPSRLQLWGCDSISTAPQSGQQILRP